MKIALLIAVENHQDTRIKPAPFAAADVADLAGVLVPHGFSEVDRIMIINGEATKGSIEARVKRALKGLGPEDELLFYYAGHGFSKEGISFLACFDTDPSRPATTSVPLNWICQQFASSECRRLAFFLDARGTGLPAADDLDDADLVEFFESGDHRVCLASCRPGETSHASGVDKHGAWAHQLIEAFAGRAPAALVKSSRLTAASLQKFLKREVPRTLTRLFTTKKTQTPQMIGSGADFLLADLSGLLAARTKRASQPSDQVKQLALLARRTERIRRLSGFKKGFKTPNGSSRVADAFVARISVEEITSDVNQVFSRLKSIFRFKRADLHLSNAGDGAATIITPYFNYSISVGLNPDDTSQAVFRRTVDAIKERDQVLSDRFAAAFDAVFDTVEFETPSPVDLPALIDQIEELDDARIAIDYDPKSTHCRLRIAGVVGDIVVTSRSVSIVQSKPGSPKQLLQSFFRVQEELRIGSAEE